MNTSTIPTSTIPGPDVTDPLAKEFYDQVYDLTPLSQLKKRRQPVLILHGTHDETTRNDAYEALKTELEFADVSATRVSVDGADHAFMSHDVESKAIAEIVKWLRP